MKKTGAILLLTLFLFSCAFFVRADGLEALDKKQPLKKQTKTKGMINGVITGINGNIVQLLGGQIQLDITDAAIRSFSSSDLTSSSVEVGNIIQASVTKFSKKNQAEPLPVNVLYITLSSEASLRANLENVDHAGMTIQLLGQTINITSDTDIRNSIGQAINFSLVQPGQGAFVQLKVDGDNLIATNISQQSAPVANDFIDAQVTAVDGAKLSVLNGRFIIDPSSATISPLYSCGNLPSAALGVGSRISVTFQAPATDTGEIVADSIDTNTAGELMVTGKLLDKDNSGGSVTLLNETIFTNDQTVIKKASGDTIKLMDLSVGKPQLIAAHLDGGRLIAGEIVQGQDDKPIALFPFCE
jgi:hypothetical protein